MGERHTLYLAGRGAYTLPEWERDIHFTWTGEGHTLYLDEQSESVLVSSWTSSAAWILPIKVKAVKVTISQVLYSGIDKLLSSGKEKKIYRMVSSYSISIYLNPVQDYVGSLPIERA